MNDSAAQSAVSDAAAVDEGELVVVRVFEAPRELVFRCMIEPEHLTRFWGPIGMSAPIEDIAVDPRPGGVFKTVMVNDGDGGRYPTRAIFDQIVVPEKLVWTETASGMTTISTFKDLGDSRTEVSIRQLNAPEMVRSPEARAGFLTSLDRLATHLAEIQA